MSAPPVPVTVTPIPLFEDNYAWRIDLPLAQGSILIDPADPGPVLSTYDVPDAPELLGVLTTHHHWDHAGGNRGIAAARPGVRIVAGRLDSTGPSVAATELVDDGTVIEMGGLRIRCIHVPVHTHGHIAYFIDNVDIPGGGSRLVFTGDTLFSGGCGRFFEGSPEQGVDSLNKLAALPDDTLVYAGHEYTVANLRFCAAVEPGNAAITARAAECRELRERGAPTLPSTIGREKEFNVFLRRGEDAVRRYVGLDGGADEVAVLGRLREAKNGFKG